MRGKLIVITLVILSFVSGGFFLLQSQTSKPQNTTQKPQKSVESLSTSPSIFPSVSPTLAGFNKVIKVIDGDTIDVEINGKKETLRLIGINTPETVDPRKPVQCFGREASNKAKEVLSGKMVRLEADQTQGERDKYKRLLRYVFLEDGTNFNKFMIVEGYAHEYTYNIPYKYQKEFKEAEATAQKGKIGLWADAACSGSTSISTQSSVIATQAANIPNGKYECNCGKTCSKISTCEEAYYQLQNCGCSQRDSDGDGVPCESLCAK